MCPRAIQRRHSWLSSSTCSEPSLSTSASSTQHSLVSAWHPEDGGSRAQGCCLARAPSPQHSSSCAGKQLLVSSVNERTFVPSEGL